MSLSKTYEPMPRDEMLQLYLSIQTMQKALSSRTTVERTHQQGRMRRGRHQAYCEGINTLALYNAQQWRLSLIKAEFLILRDLQR